MGEGGEGEAAEQLARCEQLLRGRAMDIEAAGVREAAAAARVEELTTQVRQRRPGGPAAQQPAPVSLGAATRCGGLGRCLLRNHSRRRFCGVCCLLGGL